MGLLEPTCGSMSEWGMFSTSVRRVEASFWYPGSGPLCCSVRGSGQRLERAVRFHVDQVGFTLDVDYAPNDAFRVVQLTPPGSSCSIQLGKGLTDALVGSLRNVYLVVTD